MHYVLIILVGHLMNVLSVHNYEVILKEYNRHTSSQAALCDVEIYIVYGSCASRNITERQKM